MNFGSTRLLEAAKQCEAALVATYVALEVFFSAGYFISLPKCELDPTTRLVFLGIICDSVACRFEALEDKLPWPFLWQLFTRTTYIHVSADRNFSANGRTQEEYGN